MKTALLTLLIFAIPALAPAQGLGFHRGPDTAVKRGDLNHQAAEEAAAYQQQQIDELRRNFIPCDPRRVINGGTNYAQGEGWCQFCGSITQVTPGGVLVSGLFSWPLDDKMLNADSQPRTDFFVKNFPYPVVDRQILRVDGYFTALQVANYTYPTAMHGSRTVQCLDYGKVWRPGPLTPEQLAARKKAAQQKIEAGKARALKANQDAAENGDAYGLMRMGERYRDGEDVPKDLAKAREYLTKSAAAGSSTAKEELAVLPK